MFCVRLTQIIGHVYLIGPGQSRLASCAVLIVVNTSHTSAPIEHLEVVVLMVVAVDAPISCLSLERRHKSLIDTWSTMGTFTPLQQR